MTSRSVATEFRSIITEELPLPGAGDTARRHRSLFNFGRQDLSLARLAEAHWDAIAILRENGTQPRAGCLYGVWASERPGHELAMKKNPKPFLISGKAKQFGPKGIRVNGVAPGPIWTPLQVSGGATQDHLIHFGETYPLRRAGQPAELASIYVQLAANDASYTTGNIYGAGGGAGQP